MELRQRVQIVTLKHYPATPAEVADVLRVALANLDELLSEWGARSAAGYLTRRRPSYLEEGGQRDRTAPGYLVGLADLEPDAVWYLGCVFEADMIVRAAEREPDGTRHFVCWLRDVGMRVFRHGDGETVFRHVTDERAVVAGQMLLPSSWPFQVEGDAPAAKA